MDNIEFEHEHEKIFTAVETTNTRLVENNMDHLDVIIEANIFAIGANIRMMTGDEPTAVRECADSILERMEQFMEQLVGLSEAEWGKRPIQ